MTVRLNAYTLAGDPAFLAASVRSYYPLVGRIFVAHDAAGLSWSGEAIPIDECLAQIAAIDNDRKVVLVPLERAPAGSAPMECETIARRLALGLAGEEADWVLQIDGDEVVPDPAHLLAMVERADRAAAAGLEYPSRWIYARCADGRHLETCTRLWRAAASFPGALAVRAGAELRLARQCEGELFRADLRSRNTDPWRARDAPVHATVPVAAAVLHLAWVRPVAELLAKAQTNVHRSDFDWQGEVARWQRRQRHPLLTTALTPVRPTRGRPWLTRYRVWLRRARLPIDPAPRLEPAP